MRLAAQGVSADSLICHQTENERQGSPDTTVGFRLRPKRYILFQSAPV